MSICLRSPFRILISCIVLGVLTSAHALRDADNQGRWEKPADHGPDAVVPGFLVNMGPTGARGILKESAYVVKYIFEDSPADGVLMLDDEVYGANGKAFGKHQALYDGGMGHAPYSFYRGTWRGWLAPCNCRPVSRSSPGSYATPNLRLQQVAE